MDMMLYYVLLPSLAAFVLWEVSKLLLNKHPLGSLPGPPSDSWLSGNLRRFYDPRASTYHRDLLVQYGGAINIPGLFGTKFVFLSDLVAIRHIFGQGQQAYDETPSFLTVNSLLFGHGILTTTGDAHKRQRKMLNPLFSPNHMRLLHPIMDGLASKVRDSLLTLASKDTEIDMSYWVSRAAVEIIGQAGFGYSFDDLRPTGGRQHEYTKLIKQLPILGRKLALLLAALPALDSLASRPLLRFISERLPWPALQEILHIVDVMYRTSMEVYDNSRRHVGEDMDSSDKRKDILSVLLRDNENHAEEDRLEEKEIIGQMSSFIFAGSDTSSNTISRILYLLAKHPDVQARLRNEISDAKERNGELDYDELMGLEYLDAICRETLRLYAPVPVISRQAQTDTILPLGTPIVSRDGKSELSELIIPKNTEIVLGIEAINRNKDIWGTDSEEWKPDRWVGVPPHAVAAERVPGVYSNMMTFLGGSRACIGLSFSLLEIKIMLSKLIPVLEFAPPEKEVIWLMTTIITPTVKGEESKAPYLPLKVSTVQETP